MGREDHFVDLVVRARRRAIRLESRYDAHDAGRRR